MSDKEFHPQRAVAEMMKLYGQETKTKPEIPDEDTRLLRARLVFEEAMEFVAAMGCEYDDVTHEVMAAYDKEPDLIEAADAIGDILVVTVGAANACGIDAEACFREVHRSNMTKLWDSPLGPEVRRREDGKVIKPPNYSPADMKSVLLAQGWDQPAAETK